MKRTTVMLPDDVDARLRREARRQGRPLAELVREAVEARFPEPTGKQRFSLIGAFDYGVTDASENLDKYLAEAYEKNWRESVGD